MSGMDSNSSDSSSSDTTSTDPTTSDAAHHHAPVHPPSDAASSNDPEAAVDKLLLEEGMQLSIVRPAKTKWSTKLLMLVGYIAWICLTVNLDWDRFEAWIHGAQPAEKIHMIGPVTAVHFVGGWGYDTQVDTATHSVLISGIANLEHGAMLETRSGHKGNRVCMVGTSKCWHWLGANSSH